MKKIKMWQKVCMFVCAFAVGFGVTTAIRDVGDTYALSSGDYCGSLSSVNYYYVGDDYCCPSGYKYDSVAKRCTATYSSPCPAGGITSGTADICVAELKNTSVFSSYKCFKNTTTGKYEWIYTSTGSAPSGYTTTSYTTQAACEGANGVDKSGYKCFQNTSTGVYEWLYTSTGNAPSGYTSATSYTSESACKSANYRCYKNTSTGMYEWKSCTTTGGPPSGYTTTSYTTESACDGANPTDQTLYKCCRNTETNEYAWIYTSTGSAPSGYVIESSYTTQSACLANNTSGGDSGGDSSGGGGTTTYYTITYYWNKGTSGEVYTTQTVASGSTITPPSSPSRNGYVFANWSAVSTGEAYDFSTKVTKNVELWACWTPLYTVTFDLNGGTGNISSQEIAKNKTVTKPADPTKTGYIFSHWSTTNGGSAYDFSTKVTSNLTLYAVYRANTYTVAFDLNGGTGDIPDQTIDQGGKVVKPSTNPTKEGYTFNGWSTDKACTTTDKYDFNKTVTNNFTLYACYIKKYNIKLSVVGLPFANIEVIERNEKSTLVEYSEKFMTGLVDTTTYELLDINKCVSYVKEMDEDLTDSKALAACEDLDEILSCKDDDNCYDDKYTIIGYEEDKDGKYVDLIKDLIDTGAIKVDSYDLYNYNGLYTDITCKNEYDYTKTISSNMTLYMNFSKYNPNDKTNEEIDSNAKTGNELIIIVSIAGVIALISSIYYFNKKRKVNI